MRIQCPLCGDRDTGEFTPRGDAAPTRPVDGANLTAMADYVYLRENPAGRLREHWYHAVGCRSWLVVTRDTRTHAIACVALAVDAAPVDDAGAEEIA